jgi:hypothetical protein
VVDFQRTTRRYIPEDRTVHNHRIENLISYKDITFETQGTQEMEKKDFFLTSIVILLSLIMP